MKKDKIEWVEFTRRGRNHAVLVIDWVERAFKKGYVKKEMGWSSDIKSYRQFDSARWIRMEDIEGYIQSLKKHENRRPGFLYKRAEKYIALIKRMRTFGDKVSKVSFTKKSNDQLVEYFEQLAEKSYRTFGMIYTYIFLNRYLPDQISDIIANKVSNSEKQNEYLKILFSFDKPTETHKEKLSLLKIVRDIQKKRLKLNSREFSIRVNDHLKKYDHLNLYVMYGRPYKEIDIKKRIKQLLGKDIKKELKDLDNIKNNKLIFNKAIKKLKLDKKTILKIKGAKEWIYGATLWDESFTYMIRHSYSLFKEISKRIGFKFEQLIEARHEEIIDLLKKGKKADNKFKKELASRYQDSALVFENNKIKLYSGQELKKYYRREKREEEYKEVKILKGQSASPGIVVGKVSITKSVFEINKVKKGDVLIAPATTPAHVPAMEKAVAIVTDEGGLLSHAAIVSREFKIPCVVGTKIATKVLKDGESVEVDAEKGIVRKLKD